MSTNEADGAVTLERRGAVAHVTFDRPAARNAMTRQMYGQLHAICDQLQADATLRAAVFRGAGGKAFVAGSDVRIFSGFETGEDGIAYEREMEEHTLALTRIPVPTIAAIDGWTVGGGLNLAAACDLRIATAGSRFGVPIARTVGNCLSMANYARLVAGFGAARAKRMLLLGEILDADEARACGFLAEIVEKDALDDAVTRICDTILANAPVTLRVSKAAIARLADDPGADGDDLIASCYGSRDFKAGVAGFLSGEPPAWEGR